MPDNAPLSSTVTSEDPDAFTVATTSRLGKPWQASNQCLAFLGEWESGRMNGTTRIYYSDHTHLDVQVVEGMILQVYPDDQGNPTVGCGHLVTPTDNLQTGQIISVDRARDLLKHDLELVQKRLNALVMVPLFQYEYDAMVSVVFNAGAGSAVREMADEVNHGHYDTMPAFIRRFHASNPRLRQRRVSEARLFGTGVYDASH
ncbi:lysozyme [Paraburkholderia bryophila]|uniref:lysozyme n=1 Tax=Paraburkholderia bryophila TaxID=420952 RepID=UPI002349FA77|nr:lysozyme [Paraburkholderia bryophila]WCM20427.1 lysozyme [Paraburkholderia bryophila]